MHCTQVVVEAQKSPIRRHRLVLLGRKGGSRPLPLLLCQCMMLASSKYMVQSTYTSRRARLSTSRENRLKDVTASGTPKQAHHKPGHCPACPSSGRCARRWGPPTLQTPPASASRPPTTSRGHRNPNRVGQRPYLGRRHVSLIILRVPDPWGLDLTSIYLKFISNYLIFASNVQKDAKKCKKMQKMQKDAKKCKNMQKCKNNTNNATKCKKCNKMQKMQQNTKNATKSAKTMQTYMTQMQTRTNTCKNIQHALSVCHSILF